jgi:putative flippase GtrA
VKQYLLSFANRESAFQAVKVAVVGVANTLTYLALFNVFLAIGLAWYPAVTISFVLTTLMSYALNRRWTFELTDGGSSMRETASFFAVNIAAYVATVFIIWIADAVFGPLGTIGYNIAAAIAAGSLVLPKLAGYRDVVFSRAIEEQTAPATAGTGS